MKPIARANPRLPAPSLLGQLRRPYRSIPKPLRIPERWLLIAGEPGDAETPLDEIDALIARLFPARYFVQEYIL